MTDQLGLARQTMSTDIWCLVGRIYLFLRQNGKLHYSGKKKKKKKASSITVDGMVNEHYLHL